jgi:hypothetical protein
VQLTHSIVINVVKSARRKGEPQALHIFFFFSRPYILKGHFYSLIFLLPYLSETTVKGMG